MAGVAELGGWPMTERKRSGRSIAPTLVVADSAFVIDPSDAKESTAARKGEVVEALSTFWRMIGVAATSGGAVNFLSLAGGGAAGNTDQRGK